METPQQPPYQPPVMPHPIVPQSTHKVWAIPLVVVLVLVGGYFAFAEYQSMQQIEHMPESVSFLFPSVLQSPVSDLQTFNSKYFNVSFKYSKGYEVYDSQNYIAVAKDKYQTYKNEVANGDNAFFQIKRFNQNYTKEQILRNNAWLENPKLSKIFIDDSEFTKIEGERLGGEVYQYGKTIVVVFDASSLTISQFTGGCSKNDDCFAVGNQILATLKLFSTANWKTYTNTSVGYSMQYPANLNFVNLCGGESDVVDPAITCNEATIPLPPSNTSNGLYAIMRQNKDNLPIKTFTQAVLKDAKIIESVTEKSFSGKGGATATFTGAFHFSPDPDGGGMLYDDKISITLVKLDSNNVLEITYPISFCTTSTSCFSDERNIVFKQIVETLIVK